MFPVNRKKETAAKTKSIPETIQLDQACAVLRGASTSVEIAPALWSTLSEQHAAPSDSDQKVQVHDFFF
jgi:hypothetical protein